MNWSDERYVRLYTRDTLTWRSWNWQTRAVFALLLRKVDRAGVLDVGNMDAAAALAIMVEVPTEVAAAALEQLLASGAVQATKGHLVLPAFTSAQEAKQSDRIRQEESRKRRLASATAENHDTACHAASHGVTASHTASHDVTPAVPSCAVPSRAEPAKKTAPAARVRPSDALVAAFKATTGKDYLWNGAKDGAAYAALLKVATPEEIERRWLLGLKGEGWRHTATIAQLRAKWNDLATAAPRPKGAAHLNGSGDTDWSNTPADYDGAAWLAEATGGTK